MGQLVGLTSQVLGVPFGIIDDAAAHDSGGWRRLHIFWRNRSASSAVPAALTTALAILNDGVVKSGLSLLASTFLVGGAFRAFVR